MSERTSYEHGTPSWIDLTTPDTDAAKAFYGGLFGWTFEDQFGEDGEYIYSNLKLDGKLVAGMGPQQAEMAGMPNIWNSYVNVDDADQVLKSVEAAGGTVMLPTMQVMEHGSMAVFADPTGAVICLWQPGAHTGAQIVNEPNTYSWNELMTRDVDAAKAFYAEVFGWEYDDMDMGGGMTYHVIKGGPEGGLGGLMAMPPTIPDEVPNYWGVYFTVADADAAAAKAKELGGTQMTDPIDSPGVGRMIPITDPQGGSFTLMQPESQG